MHRVPRVVLKNKISYIIPLYIWCCYTYALRICNNRQLPYNFFILPTRRASNFSFRTRGDWRIFLFVFILSSLWNYDVLAAVRRVVWVYISMLNLYEIRSLLRIYTLARSGVRAYLANRFGRRAVLCMVSVEKKKKLKRENKLSLKFCQTPSTTNFINFFSNT